MQALLLPLDDDLYAVELGAVREVLETPALTRVPGAPPAALGVFNLRGEVVPLLDTAQLLGVGRTGVAPWVAIADTASGPAGLTAAGRPEPAELGARAGASPRGGTVARYAAGERLATVLDVDALVGRL